MTTEGTDTSRHRVVHLRSKRRERRLLIALGLNAVIVVGQVIAGISAHSLGLISDAGHNLTDVAALVLSLLALRVARRSPTSSHSFGWHRGTVLAAQANAALTLVLTAWILFESIRRLIDPPHVDGGIVVVVALIAFVINGVSALAVKERTEAGQSSDLNMRSALLHLASDAAASLGVALAGSIMIATGGWNRLDPAVSIGIAMLIGWHAWKLLKTTNVVLLEGTPEGLDPHEVLAAISAADGVEAAHDLHVWTISSDVLALSVHVVVEGHPSLEQAQQVANEVRRGLAATFHITHATIELECETCEDTGPACDIHAVEVSAPATHHH